MRRGWWALLLAICALPALAQETILDYSSELRIQADGSLDVTETIRVRAEGQRIRRGIYRDFPTRYKDRLGNRVEVDFELLGVQRDGRPEPHFTERRANGIRINTGNDDFLPVPAEFTYTLRYRTTRQLGYFVDHDELYWNVNGLGWDFPIESVSARVLLPADVPASQLKLFGYTGTDGATGDDYVAEVLGPREVGFRTTRRFGSYEGLTVAVGFPKGLVPEPTWVQRMAWFFQYNLGAFVALTGLLLVLAFYWWRWHLVGRDPQAGPIFPRYEAPADFAAGEVRMLCRMSYDNRCFAADVVQMAVRGYLDIHAEGDEWRLVRRSGASLDALSKGQQAIAEKLFVGSGEVVLKNTEAARVGGARTAHNAALAKRLSPKFFVNNGGSLGLGLLFSVVCMVIAFVIAGGNGLVVLIGVSLAMLAAHVVFGGLLKAPTPEGRRRMDEIEGLRLYLSVAERDEIRAMKTPGSADEPPLDAGRYEQLLPYALALDVEAEWSHRFTRAVGLREAQASQPGWYRGGYGSAPMGLAGLGSSLGSALTEHISSSATPPGSSSGSGGGGFSGGGGGGGGGGGR